jgi:hypothetical protein
MSIAYDPVTGVVIKLRFPAIGLLSLFRTEVQTSCPRACFPLIKSEIIGEALA